MDKAVILHGAHVAQGPRETIEQDIEIRNGKIHALRKPSKSARGIDLTGHLILPGLINAHDHLEFNLYPRLGRGPYPNAGAWSRDVYHPAESPIREQLAIPKETRLLWGGLKNLLSGVTTVCHHNPRDQPVLDRSFPIRVVKQFGWAHSLEFSPDLAGRFRATPADWPFIVHLGEGVDRKSQREIFQLDELGALGSRTVLVHAVALGRRGLRLANEKGAAIIWCPTSNLFLLGRTLNGALHSGIPLALGNDSTISAQGDLLDEMRAAQAYLPDDTIYRMVTDTAARILRLPAGFGGIEPGGPADLIAIPDRNSAPSAALMRARSPALVVVAGRVKLISAKFPQRMRCLQSLNVAGRGRFFVDANITSLRREIGSHPKLAGRRILP